MNLVKKADLARLGNVEPSLISKNIREGGLWHHALDIGAQMIDVDDPVIAEWLKSREPEPEVDTLNLKKYENMTLKKIIQKHGGIAQFFELAKTYKLLAEIEYKKIQIEASRNDLVSRDFMGKMLFGFLEQATTQLLQMPAGRVPKIMAVVESGALDAKEKVEELLVKETSKILESVKRQILEGLGDDFAEKA